MSAILFRIAIFGLIAAALNSHAQTRTDEIEKERREKSLAIHPEKVSRFEYMLLQIKQRKLLERISTGYNGLRIQIGSLATGSGFAAGPDFLREDLLDGKMRINAGATVSAGLWQKYQAGFTFPRLAGGRLSLQLEAVRRDYRALEFYGMGLNSRREDRTDYRLEDTSIEAVAAVRINGHVRLGGSVGGLWPEIAEGNNDDLPDMDAVFDDLSAPGFSSQGNFLRTSVFGQIDYRDDPAGPKAGGNYVAEYSVFDDRSIHCFGFHRWDVDLQQYIPFFNRSRRIALRARMTMTDSECDQRTPFYLQPYLGGSDDLRGFQPYRFTGPNAIVYNAEYRWEIFSGLDGALFIDAGKVMERREHMRFSDLEVSYGFGFRFNARNRTFIRLDAGFSREGAIVWLKFNDPFLPRLFGAGTRQPLY